MKSQDLACPQCKSIDCVRKVSAVVKEGTSRGEGIAWNARAIVSVSNTNRTQLSEQLSLPIRHFKILRALQIISIVILCLGIPIEIMVIFDSMQHPQYAEGTVECFALPVVLGTLILIPTLIIKQQKQTKERQKWMKAYPIWDQFYYCFRDDIVFIPSSPDQYMPASQLRPFLGYYGRK